MDPIELMLTGNRDEEMQKALSAGLRRRREIGELAQLTGDEILTPFGQGLSTQTMREVEGQVSALDRKAQRDLTSGYYKHMAEQAGLAQTMALRKQAEIERHNRAMEEKATSTYQKTLERDVQKLSATITKLQLPDIQTGIANIDEELQPYITANEGLPGIGGISNIGPAFTADGRRMQARVAKIRNMILKARSGGAVTPQEASRLLEEFSLGIFNSDEEFLASWQDFKDTIAAGEQNAYAGFTDEVVDQYHSNMSRQAGEGVEEPSGKPGAPGTAKEGWWDK